MFDIMQRFIVTIVSHLHRWFYNMPGLTYTLNLNSIIKMKSLAQKSILHYDQYGLSLNKINVGLLAFWCSSWHDTSHYHRNQFQLVATIWRILIQSKYITHVDYNITSGKISYFIPSNARESYHFWNKI